MRGGGFKVGEGAETTQTMMSRMLLPQKGTRSSELVPMDTVAPRTEVTLQAIQVFRLEMRLRPPGRTQLRSRMRALQQKVRMLQMSRAPALEGRRTKDVTSTI